MTIEKEKYQNLSLNHNIIQNVVRAWRQGPANSQHNVEMLFKKSLTIANCHEVDLEYPK